MAETEVTVSVEDMVEVKSAEEEDADPDNQSKTQMILQLQPITAGLGDESSETDAAVVAVETQDEASAEGEGLELGYPITCGESKAILLVKKFVCPGINVKCVKYEDQLISPKQFVHLSGKATLKDWKRAIRMGGVMLRKMMDSGQLDFYQHSTLCTNTCRSTKFDLLINNTRFPPDGSGLSTPTTAQGHVSVGNGGQTATAEEKKEDVIGTVEWSTATVESPEKGDSPDISDETLSFWRGIAEVGLMGEVVSNIHSELLSLLRGVQLRTDQSSLQDAEIAVLSNLAQVFDLLDSIKQILNVRRQMTDPEQTQVLRALTALEQQVEEQKRQQTLSWLSQSQALSSLVLPSTPPSKRTPKRPRLQRPASTTVLGTSVAQPLTLQPQQFTVLSPITLSSIGQSFAVAGLNQASNTVTLHALPAGSQLFTRIAAGSDGKTDAIALHPASGLTLLGATAVPDHGQLVSPVELVQFTQKTTSDVAQDGQVVAGTVMMQESVVSVVQEDENQDNTTLIEIDPAAADHSVSVMELQLEGEEAEGGATVVEGGEEVVQGETEEEIQLDANGQFHNLPVVVVEEETQGAGKAK
ncbi:glucocorticoid modulatory element-binding protein 1-like isoform X2 [Sinocyclocheilus grahami]|uniref:glucocorticoid modulatory element-binding protein 1-like isoform X1 n=1 Tax=Sinocyclocheilus grahami TaxID=75366 RepID=UPI0007ACDA5F|nr:PREDICTED: glucocorticoid modulatory element-binding protein 1-like isoform X1 [Sinocyclocheilus grahami]XP_016095616.1 PREDICTED: glucocorticoid modulatory element-binding protein 1-like isoform X1 [Sinocyclocheilus grahami]XP_016095617.1 PREDICTED: glucocorticoid modulatory element-binding protein 1-like isoform X1 [Sinocyclocheilus grahami]XP_016095619.1 PREDICTED: glucocorticoid modulatory element-binding protein 1-like isoform X1 [Sinocyclocheilus grahami]XP_016095620.1 PREDICTED: gluco